MRVIPEHATPSELAVATRFTGRVWRTDYLVPDDARSLAGFRFSYEPGARSHWHLHDREQVIVGVSGHGVVAWEGGAHRLTPGDWWHVDAGVAHWHGATPESPFAHLAVSAGGGTTWLHEVSDDDYAEAAERSRRAALGGA